MKINHSTSIIIAILFCLCSVNLYSQAGREFWFAAPDITSGHGDKPISVVITTTNNAANIVISQPANSGFAPITFNVPANSVQKYDLTTFVDDIETKGPDVVENTGLLIEASVPVSAYYEFGGLYNYEGGATHWFLANSDLLALKGSTGLGTEFYVSQQSDWTWANDHNYIPVPLQSFEIVATEDNTRVTITPNARLLGGHLAGIPFDVYLDRGQTYAAIMDDSFYAYGDIVTLYGSHITSTKDVAVTLTGDSQQQQENNNEKPDLLADQTVPIDRLGKEYIAIQGNADEAVECVFVMAVENTTTIEFNGGNSVTINAGESTSFCFDQAGSDRIHIDADKDVYVYQTSGLDELGASILPPVDECTGSNEVGFTRTPLYDDDGTEELIMNILLQDDGSNPQNNFEMYINGVLEANAIQGSDFSTVSTTNSGTWLYASINVNLSRVDTGDAVKVINHSAVFHLGILHGLDKSARFGYLAGFNDFEVDVMVEGITEDPAGICVTETYQLVATGGVQYEWTTTTPPALDFLSATDIANPTITVPDGADGTYQYIVDIYNPCQATPKQDTLNIKAEPKPDPPGGDDIEVCLGEPVPDYTTTSSESNPYYYWYSDEFELIEVQQGSSNTYASGETAPGSYDIWVTQALTSSAVCHSEPHKMSLTIHPDSLARLQVNSPVNDCPAVDLTAYPVTIGSTGGKPDTISFQDDGSYTGTRDAYIGGKWTSSDPHPSGNLQLGKDGQGSDRSVLVKWDLSAIPKNAVIQDVKLTFTFHESNLSRPVYELYQVNQDWKEASATWYEYSTGNSWDTEGAPGAPDRGTTVLGEMDNSGLQWGNKTVVPLNNDGVSVVQDWVSETSPNYGFIIQDYSNTDKQQLNSREDGTIDKRPKITIIYSDLNLSYFEDDQTTPVSNPDSITNGGTYYIQSGHGYCQATSPVEVNIICCPDHLISGSSVTNVQCNNDTNGTITVSVDNGQAPYDYTWTSLNGGSGTDNGDKGNQTGLTVGDYNVVVEDANGCRDTAAFTINASNNILADAGADVAICSGDTVTLRASGGDDYTWSTGDNTDSTSVSPALSMLYIVTVSNIAGCKDMDSVYVNVNPVPGIDTVISSDPTDCGVNDGYISIVMKDAGSYEYSLNGSAFDNTTGIFEGLSSGTFDNIQVREGSCVTTYPGSVQINMPDAPVIDSVTYEHLTECAIDNGTITIHATRNGGPLEYSLNNTDWTSINEFTGLEAQTYSSISVRDSLSPDCKVIYPDIILTKPQFPVITGIDSTIPSDCDVSDGSIEIEATGPGMLEYKLDDGNWQLDSTFSGLDSKIYHISVRVNQTTTCLANKFVQLSSPNTPVINMVYASGPTSCIKNNGSIIVSAHGANDLQYKLNNQSWQDDSLFTDLKDTIYTVYVRPMSMPACTTNALPDTLKRPGNPILYAVEDNISICSGTPLELTAIGPEITGWSWIGPKKFTSDLQSPVIHLSDTSDSGEYIVTGIDGNDCETTDTVNVHVKLSAIIIDTIYNEDTTRYRIELDLLDSIYGPYNIGEEPDFTPYQTDEICVPEMPFIPCPDISGPEVYDVSYCENMPVPELSAEAGYGYTLYWYDSIDTTTTIYPPGDKFTPDTKKPGSYTYAVQAKRGSCTTKFSYAHVIVHPLPDIDAGQDRKLCKEDNTTISVNGSGAYDYEWNTGEIGQVIDVFDFQDNTEYIVTATNEYGCTAKDTMWLYLKFLGCFDIPTAFSPNGDHINDEWTIKGLAGNPEYTQVIVYVYDRWGEMIFRSKPGYSNTWDGTYKEMPLPVDSYHFLIDLFNNGEEVIKGQVTIIR